VSVQDDMGGATNVSSVRLADATAEVMKREEAGVAVGCISKRTILSTKLAFALSSD